MLREIVKCTNKYIDNIQKEFKRLRYAKITDIIEMKALIATSILKLDNSKIDHF